MDWKGLEAELSVLPRALQKEEEREREGGTTLDGRARAWKPSPTFRPSSPTTRERASAAQRTH